MELESKKLQIRSIYQDEYEDVMGIVWKTFLRFEAQDYTEEGVKSFQDFITDPTLYKMFLRGHYQIFGAFYQGKNIGMISLRDRTHISLLFVDEKYHYQGVGRALMDYLKKYLVTEKGEHKVTVNASPYGGGFYHKLGFQDTDREQEKEGVRYTPMILLL